MSPHQTSVDGWPGGITRTCPAAGAVQNAATVALRTSPTAWWPAASPARSAAARAATSPGGTPGCWRSPATRAGPTALSSPGLLLAGLLLPGSLAKSIATARCWDGNATGAS